jgi:hypothetical protein
MKSELLENAKRMTWKEYVKNLDISHWDWRNAYPWNDREVYFLGNKLIVYPIYPEDILEDVNVNYELLDDGIAVSWDGFKEDCVILTDAPEEPIAYLLVEEVDEYHWGLVVDRIFTEVSELKEFFDNDEQIERFKKYFEEVE